MTFPEAERAAVYKAIHTRRDVRSEFLSDQILRRFCRGFSTHRTTTAGGPPL